MCYWRNQQTIYIIISDIIDSSQEFVQIYENENDECTYATHGDVKVSKCSFEHLEDDKLDIEKEISSVVDDSPFESLNHASCVSPLEQELSAYKALKESYLEGAYNNCCTLIKYYFGHIDYAKEFGYCKTHGEIGFILFTNLLYSIESGKDSFINFIDSMINKIEWNLENKEFLENNGY